jgi:hypothetical protein
MLSNPTATTVRIRFRIDFIFSLLSISFCEAIFVSLCISFTSMEGARAAPNVRNAMPVDLEGVPRVKGGCDDFSIRRDYPIEFGAIRTDRLLDRAAFQLI